MTVMNNK